MQWLPARVLLQESPRPPPVPRHMAVQCRPPHSATPASTALGSRAVQSCSDHRAELLCVAGRGPHGRAGLAGLETKQQQPPASLSRSIQLLLLLLRLAGLRLDS